MVLEPATRPKVLIVDDEHLIARTLSLILNQSGFRAVPIYRPWAAIQIAEGLKPDILITDISMPGLDGFEIAAKVCALVPKCRVFFLSARYHLEGVHEFQSKGYRFEFLHKPIHPSELLNRLRATSQSSIPLLPKRSDQHTREKKPPNRKGDVISITVGSLPACHYPNAVSEAPVQIDEWNRRAVQCLLADTDRALALTELEDVRENSQLVQHTIAKAHEYYVDLVMRSRPLIMSDGDQVAFQRKLDTLRARLRFLGEIV